MIDRISVFVSPGDLNGFVLVSEVVPFGAGAVIYFKIARQRYGDTSLLLIFFHFVAGFRMGVFRQIAVRCANPAF